MSKTILLFSAVSIVAIICVFCFNVTWLPQQVEQRQEQSSIIHASSAAMPSKAIDHCAYGDGHMKENLNEVAYSDFSKAIETNNRNHYAYYRRSLTGIRLKKFTQALDDINTAVNLDVSNADYYKTRGDIKSLTNDQSGAIVDYDRAISIDPKKSAYYWIKAHTLYQSGDIDASIKALDDGIFHCSNELSLFERRAEMYEEKREWKLAIKDYEFAIRICPDSGKNQCRLSYVLSTCPSDDVRDGKAALALAKSAMPHIGDFHLDQAFLHEVLAAAYAETGNFESAVKNQNKAIELWRIQPGLLTTSHIALDLYKQNKPYRRK